MDIQKGRVRPCIQNVVIIRTIQIYCGICERRRLSSLALLNILFIFHVWLWQVLWLRGLFSSCGARFGGFSYCGAQAPARGLRSCSAWPQLLLGRDLPGPGIEPVSPSLAGLILYHWSTREAPITGIFKVKPRNGWCQGCFQCCWPQKYRYGWSVKSTGKFMAVFCFCIFVLKYKSNTSPYWKIWKS